MEFSKHDACISSPPNYKVDLCNWFVPHIQQIPFSELDLFRIRGVTSFLTFSSSIPALMRDPPYESRVPKSEDDVHSRNTQHKTPKVGCTGRMWSIDGELHSTSTEYQSLNVMCTRRTRESKTRCEFLCFLTRVIYTNKMHSNDEIEIMFGKCEQSFKRNNNLYIKCKYNW